MIFPYIAAATISEQSLYKTLLIYFIKYILLYNIISNNNNNSDNSFFSYNNIQ